MGKREGNQEIPSPEEVRQMHEKIRQLPTYVPPVPTEYDEYTKDPSPVDPKPRG